MRLIALLLLSMSILGCADTTVQVREVMVDGCVREAIQQEVVPEYVVILAECTNKVYGVE